MTVTYILSFYVCKPQKNERKYCKVFMAWDAFWTMETKVITHIYHYQIYHVTANYGILGKTAYSKKRIFSMPSNCQGLEYNSINVLLNKIYVTLIVIFLVNITNHFVWQHTTKQLLIFMQSLIYPISLDVMFRFKY